MPVIIIIMSFQESTAHTNVIKILKPWKNHAKSLLFLNVKHNKVQWHGVNRPNREGRSSTLLRLNMENLLEKAQKLP